MPTRNLRGCLIRREVNGSFRSHLRRLTTIDALLKPVIQGLDLPTVSRQSWSHKDCGAFLAIGQTIGIFPPELPQNY